LAAAVAAALDAAGAPKPASVGLILTNDGELGTLNERAMGRSEPTDVLSFPLLPSEAFPPHERRPIGQREHAQPIEFALPPGRRPHLGDVVMSVQRAIEQADSGRGGQTGDVRWSAVDELMLLAIHGTLHLCGWDHAEPAEEAAMRQLERKLLKLD
jgi:probable rRNA maturation factor